LKGSQAHPKIYYKQGETVTAAEALVEELIAEGFIVSGTIPVGSTHELTKSKDGINHVVKMNLTEKKVDVFYGAFQNGDKLQHQTWRIASDKKKKEVSWKIRSAESSLSR
jgi:hypothetical protein